MNSTTPSADSSMHLSQLLTLSTLVMSASATTHRVCCCAGKDKDGYFHCSGVAADSVIDSFKDKDGGRRFVKSKRIWPTNFGLNGWMYASSKHDDGWIGGDEISGICGNIWINDQYLSSRCYDPVDAGKHAEREKWENLCYNGRACEEH